MYALISFGFDDPKSDTTEPNFMVVSSVSEVGPIRSAVNSHQTQPDWDAANTAPQAKSLQVSSCFATDLLDDE